MDYHTIKRIDNTRLSRTPAPARLKGLWRLCATSAAMTACLLFYAWQHFECIQIRYQLEQMESQRGRAVQLNEQLHLEVAALRSPMRVDAIARNQLGLTVPVPGQMAPADSPADGALAQAQSAPQIPRP